MNIKDFSKPVFAEEKIRISAWKISIAPLKMLVFNWQKILLLILPTALLLTAISLLCKRNIVCSTGFTASLNTDLCTDDFGAFAIDLILRTLILMFFAIKWYQVAFLKKTITINNFFSLSFDDLKACGLMLFFIMINLTPAVGIILLAIRQVTPDWRVELVYFTSVAWIFLLPIIALRFYSLLAFALAHQQTPPLRILWIRSSGNMLKFLLGAAMIVFLALFIFMQYYAAINAIAEFTMLNAFMAEFEYDVLVALFTAYWLAYCYVQKKLLFEGETND